MYRLLGPFRWHPYPNAFLSQMRSLSGPSRWRETEVGRWSRAATRGAAHNGSTRRFPDARWLESREGVRVSAPDMHRPTTASTGRAGYAGHAGEVERKGGARKRALGKEAGGRGRAGQRGQPGAESTGAPGKRCGILCAVCGGRSAAPKRAAESTHAPGGTRPDSGRLGSGWRA